MSDHMPAAPWGRAASRSHLSVPPFSNAAGRGSGPPEPHRSFGPQHTRQNSRVSSPRCFGDRALKVASAVRRRACAIRSSKSTPSS